MKLKDVLLITNNNKGTEYKYLSSMKDYMTVLFRAFEGSETELAHAGAGTVSDKGEQPVCRSISGGK